MRKPRAQPWGAGRAGVGSPVRARRRIHARGGVARFLGGAPIAPKGHRSPSPGHRPGERENNFAHLRPNGPTNRRTVGPLGRRCGSVGPFSQGGALGWVNGRAFGPYWLREELLPRPPTVSPFQGLRVAAKPATQGGALGFRISPHSGLRSTDPLFVFLWRRDARTRLKSFFQ